VDISERSYGPVSVFAPVGRVDLTTGDVFQKRLLGSVARGKVDGSSLVLDFSEVGYISSIGLRAIMMAAKQAKANNTKLALANLSPTVKEIFDISGFSSIIKILPTTREALAWVSEQAASAFDLAASKA
jgi:anti-anti-sigma factor